MKKPSLPILIAASVVLVIFIAAVLVLALTGNFDKTNGLVTACVTFGGLIAVLFGLNQVPTLTATKINGNLTTAIQEAIRIELDKRFPSENTPETPADSRLVFPPKE